MLTTGVSQAGLENLHEISQPALPGAFPPAGGWYVILVVVVLASGWWVYGRLTRFWKNRYRRLALAELAVIERELTGPGARAPVLLKLSALMKRTALSAFQRTEVAELSGEKWLAFLDRTLGGSDFAEGPGRLLGEIAYLPAARLEMINDESITGLLRLSRRWIKGHIADD